MSYYGDSTEDSFEDFLEWRRFKKERRRHKKQQRERELLGLEAAPSSSSSSSSSARPAARQVSSSASRSLGGVGGGSSSSGSAPAAAPKSRSRGGKDEEVEVGGAALSGKSFQEKLSAAPNKGALRKQLKAQVDAVLEAGSYTTSDGSVVELSQADIAASRDGVKVYSGNETWSVPKGTFATTAHFVKADSIETAMFLQQRKGTNPVVLIPADPSTLGGGNKGNESLEEQLFRRTSVGTALDADSYKIPEGGAIYVPNALVFRDGEQKSGYAWFKEPRKVSFLLASSVRNPKYETVKGVVELEKTAAEQTKATLRTVLNAAIKNKHDAIVLTAFGCGYNGNPPQAVAGIFRDLLTGEFASAFKHVTFAILEDASPKAHNPEGNTRPFQVEFLTVRKTAANSQGCC